MHARYLAGRITVVQEERFRLTTEDGRSFLFVLDRKSPIHIAAVRRLQKSRTPVRVEYSGEPNTRSGIAQLVQAAEKCPVAAIHPGTPLNPKEKDLDKWLKRAQAF